MLGTSTAPGNVSEEGKTCVIFTSRRSKLVAKVQGTRRNFPRLTLLLPLSYQTTATTFHSKVRLSFFNLFSIEFFWLS